MKHLVFYDGKCGVCQWSVRFLIKIDKEKLFVFAPLDGPTARLHLNNYANTLQGVDSLVLLENYQTVDQQKLSIYAAAVFRICWLLGGLWKSIGILSFLPSQPFDWLYRQFAKRRRLIKAACPIDTKIDQQRLLP